MFGQPAATSSDAPPAKTFVFGQNQDSQPPAPSAAPLNSVTAPAPAQPFIFGVSSNAAPPPAAAPAFGFGAAAAAAAPSAVSSTGLYLLLLVGGLRDNYGYKTFTFDRIGSCFPIFNLYMYLYIFILLLFH